MSIVDGIAVLIQIAMGITLIWLSIRHIRVSKKPLTRFWKIGVAIALALGSCILISTLTSVFLMVAKTIQK